MHVSVCICTYRRPTPLRRLLAALERQITHGEFTFSLVVADNDAALSGRAVVEEFAARSSLQVVYCTEPRRNIALARNRAAEHAHGEFVAWIDDDEFPDPGWLRALVAAARRYPVSGVLGPVRPHFDEPPPRWLVAGRFCERPEHPTGTTMHWSQSFAGNALVRLDAHRALAVPFRVEFGLGGEDVDFFRRLALLGHRFVWCNEAVVHEVVPPGRWTRRYRLQRAMMLGESTLELAGGTALLKSCVAVPLYALILPGTLILGQHVFMKYGIKLCAHAGRLLAAVGLNPIRQRPA